MAYSGGTQLKPSKEFFNKLSDLIFEEEKNLPSDDFIRNKLYNLRINLNEIKNFVCFIQQDDENSQQRI